VGTLLHGATEGFEDAADDQASAVGERVAVATRDGQAIAGVATGQATHQSVHIRQDFDGSLGDFRGSEIHRTSCDLSARWPWNLSGVRRIVEITQIIHFSVFFSRSFV
jgi:hypothetical protein